MAKRESNWQNADQNGKTQVKRQNTILKKIHKIYFEKRKLKKKCFFQNGKTWVKMAKCESKVKNTSWNGKMWVKIAKCELKRQNESQNGKTKVEMAKLQFKKKIQKKNSKICFFLNMNKDQMTYQHSDL